MKKIISLFKRDYTGDRLVYDEIVPGAEWVRNGEGIATIKYDGTCCMIKNGELYKRYDRKLSKSSKKRILKSEDFILKLEDYKPPPPNWIPAENSFDIYTGHWPGWVPVRNGPEDRWHREGFENSKLWGVPPIDGTYELVGPKIQSNPYSLDRHELWPHGVSIASNADEEEFIPRTFNELKQWFLSGDGREIEGIVWHHSDGRMAKIKRRDFGLKWPANR